MYVAFKKFAIAAVIATPGIALADNTITFQGEVTDQTCAVTVNGTTGNATVLLPTVSSADLAAANTKAGATPFTLGVSGCSPTGPQAVKFKFNGRNVDANGNLSNIAGSNPASNVALQLLESVGGSQINLSGGVVTANSVINLNGAASGSHDFGVQYISVPGSATAGLVTGVTEYTASYQ